jgi:hypothetical protein
MATSQVTRVVHVRREKFDIYIGRAFAEFHESIWCNPFKVEPGCGRKCVIQKFRQHLLRSPELMARLHEVRNKILGCWCKDKPGKRDIPCHGDVIAELADLCDE